jgi:hypothetical protein
MIWLVSATLVILFASLAVSAGPSRGEPASRDCLAKPGSGAGEGQHWYYRVDRASKRRCWYLGEAGAKVSKPAFSKRRSALRSTVKRTGKILAEDVIATAPTEPDPTETPVQPAADENSNDFSTRWPGYVKSIAVERELELTRNSYAEEHSTAHSSDDMPLIWPILNSAELAAAGQPVYSALRLPLFLLLIAGALALAAVIARCKLLAAERFRRRGPGVRRRPIAKTAHPRRSFQFPGTVAAGPKSAVPAKPPVALRRIALGRELPTADGIPMGLAPEGPDPSHRLRKPAGRVVEKFGPWDLGPDVEESLRQLLRRWQRVAA